MLNVVLVAPEIPQNTGNIARTCAATGSVLHLIRPLGFDISERAVRRAGLDYWHLVDVRVYDDLGDFYAKNNVAQQRLFSTKAPRSYCDVSYDDGWLPVLRPGDEGPGRSRSSRPIMMTASASPSARRHAA